MVRRLVKQRLHADVRLELTQRKGILKFTVQAAVTVHVDIDPACHCARLQHHSWLQGEITDVCRCLLRLPGTIGQTFVDLTCLLFTYLLTYFTYATCTASTSWLL